MQRLCKESYSSFRPSLDLHGRRGETEGMDRVPDALEEEDEVEMGECVPELSLENGEDEEWNVGAWTSSIDVCKIARAGGRAETAGARRKKGLFSATSRDKSSFESLDLRAAEILDKSMQALESSTSLKSCALLMTTNYSLHWEGGEVGGGWKVGKCKRKEDQVWGAHNCNPSKCLRSYQNLVGTTTNSNHGYCEYHMPQVLREILHNHNDDGVKLSSTKAKPQEDSVGGMSLKDLHGISAKENTFRHGWADNGKLQLWNEAPRKNFMHSDGGGSGQVLPRAMPEAGTSMEQANEEGGASLGEKTRDATSCPAVTLDSCTQTKLTGTLSCKMLPPKVKGSGGLRLPIGNKAEFQSLQDHRVSCLLRGRRIKGPGRSNYGAKDRTHSEKRKLLFPSKPPTWKGLCTALSVMRSICHGVGEVGVVNAQARPLLIIAGKCVFRTNPPLDTPRLCTDFNDRKDNVPKASTIARDNLPPTRSSVVSRDDAKKASSHAQPMTGKPMPPNVTSIDSLSCTLPLQEKYQATSSSIKHWPAVVTELDSWILQIVSEWLDDKVDHAVAIEKNSRTLKTNIGNLVSASSHEVCSEEKLGEFCVLPVSKVVELSNQLMMSQPNMAEELGEPLNAPGKMLIELDARIGEAQTVQDLSHMFEPISQASIPSAPGSLVARDMKLSSMPIIQEFGKDDVVQEFQRQIYILEQENE